MGKRLWLPPPENQPARAPWYQLGDQDRIEELKERTDGQDARLAKIEEIVGLLKKLVLAALIAAAGALGTKLITSYQLVRTGQTILPPGSDIPSTAPDFVDKRPLPQTR